MVTKTKKKLKVGEGAKKLDELLTTRKKKREETDPKILNWNLQPTEDDTGVEKWLIWTTECGRYKIGRAKMGEEQLGYVSILRSLETQKDLEFLELDKKAIGNHPRKYKRLDSALESVEHHLAKSLGVEEVISNSQDVLIAADKAGLTKEPDPPPQKRAKPAPVPARTAPGSPPIPKKGESPRSRAERLRGGSGGVSNKEIVYKAWEKGLLDPDKLMALLPADAVKMSSLKAWLGSWKKGNNLPACAK